MHSLAIITSCIFSFSLSLRWAFQSSAPKICYFSFASRSPASPLLITSLRYWVEAACLKNDLFWRREKVSSRYDTPSLELACFYQELKKRLAVIFWIYSVINLSFSCFSILNILWVDNIDHIFLLSFKCASASIIDMRVRFCWCSGT